MNRRLYVKRGQKQGLLSKNHDGETWNIRRVLAPSTQHLVKIWEKLLQLLRIDLMGYFTTEFRSILRGLGDTRTCVYKILSLLWNVPNNLWILLSTISSVHTINERLPVRMWPLPGFHALSPSQVDSLPSPSRGEGLLPAALRWTHSEVGPCPPRSSIRGFQLKAFLSGAWACHPGHRPHHWLPSRLQGQPGLGSYLQHCGTNPDMTSGPQLCSRSAAVGILASILSCDPRWHFLSYLMLLETSECMRLSFFRPLLGQRQRIRE